MMGFHQEDVWFNEKLPGKDSLAGSGAFAGPALLSGIKGYKSECIKECHSQSE